MALDNDINEILAHVGETRSDTWGRQAARIAEGIDGSQAVQGLVSSAARQEAVLFSVASIVGSGMAAIAAQLARNNEFLQQIADSLRNPLRTAADERYRRGVQALRKGWIPEAVEELTAATATDPYFPLSHIQLGLAYVEAGEPVQAAESLARAVRYALPDEPALAVGVALLRASVLAEAGDVTAALSALDTVSSYQAVCPELVLLRSRLSGSTRGVKDALTLAPELALYSVVSDERRDVEEIAAAVAKDDHGPVADAKKTATIVSRALPILREQYPEMAELLAVGDDDPGRALYLAGRTLGNAQVFSQHMGHAVHRAKTSAAELASDRQSHVREVHAYGTMISNEREALRRARNKAAAATIVPIVFAGLLAAVSAQAGWGYLIFAGVLGGLLLLIFGAVTYPDVERHSTKLQELIEQRNAATIRSASLIDTTVAEDLAILSAEIDGIARHYAKRLQPWGTS